MKPLRKFLKVLLLAIALVYAFCLGWLSCLFFSSLEVEDEVFSVSVKVNDFTEKVQVKFFSENGSFELVNIDGVDYSFFVDLSFHEADRVNVYVLTDKEIELWSSQVVVSDNYQMLISNSSTGVKVDYLEVFE
ncbi:MAG: hypothetical protein WC325_13165 [Candidatus Bathyarchaeia archaeon]